MNPAKYGRSGTLTKLAGMNLGGMAALVFLGALLLFLPPSLTRLSVFDEGFVVAGAAEVLRGQIPYRDFYSLYGPASFYLTGALYSLFGEDLLVSRLAHVLMLAAIVTTSFVLANSANGNDRRWLPWVVAAVSCAVIIGCKPNSSYPAIPATLLVLIAAVAFAKWAHDRKPRMLVICSMLIGAAGLFRWDFGIFGLLAAGSALLFIDAATRQLSVRRFGRSLIPATAPAVLLMGLTYLPLILISDPGRWFREVVIYSLFEFSKNRGTEFFRPAYWHLFWSAREGDTIETYRAIFDFAAGTLPPIIAVSALVIAWRALRRDVSNRAAVVSSIQSVFLAFLSLALFHQMRVRPNPVQGLPALLAAVPLLAYLVSMEAVAKIRIKALRGCVYIAAFSLGIIVVSVAFDEILKSLSSEFDPPALSRATGIRNRKSNAYYAELVRYIAGKTQPGEPIYSGVRDHSTLLSNDPLLYFLTNRPSSTRFLQMDPGTANTLGAQREIRDGLEQKGVKLIVLRYQKSDEPNLSSTSNGILLLDRFISERYRETRSFGPYTVLELSR